MYCVLLSGLTPEYEDGSGGSLQCKFVCVCECVCV